MKKFFIAFSCLTLVFASCKKDKDEATDTSAITTQNISGTYTFGSVTVKQGNAAPEDITDFWFDEPCVKDDQITLNANGTAVFTDAGVKCNPPGDDTGIWALTSNNTKLNLDGEELTIQSFDGKILKVGETGTDNGVAYTLTITLNKK